MEKGLFMLPSGHCQPQAPVLNQSEYKVSAVAAPYPPSLRRIRNSCSVMRVSDSDSTGSDEAATAAPRSQNAPSSATLVARTARALDSRLWTRRREQRRGRGQPAGAPQPPPGAGAGAGATGNAAPTAERGGLLRDGMLAERGLRWRAGRASAGQRVPKGGAGGGKNYQHILPAVLPVLGVQHLLAVVGSVIVNARAIGNDGTCSAGSECDVAIKSNNESAAAIEACHTEGCYMASDSEFYEHVVVWTVFISGLCTMLQSGPLGPLSSNRCRLGTSSAFVGTIANTGHRAPPGQGVGAC